MIESLSKLLDPASFFTLTIIFIIATVVIVLRGKAITAKFGNKSLKIGGESKNRITTSTTTTKKKRSCGDCILLLMGEREKHETQIRKETNKILKAQMTFAEQKIIGIQNKILLNVTGILKESPTDIEESIQYKLIHGIIKDALYSVKDEIRRSFKDNGFYGINGSEFSWYTKERTRIIIDMLNLHIQNVYPEKKELLSLCTIIDIIKEESTYLSGTILDIYSFAREIKLECDNKVENISIKFSQWVDSFTK